MTPEEMRPPSWALGLLAVVVAAAVAFMLIRAPSDQAVYTLYRNSVTDPSMRIHVATFDAKDGDRYNQENCGIVLEQLQRRPEVTVKWWCEKGRFVLARAAKD